MIGPRRFIWLDGTVSDLAHEDQQLEWRFGQIDLAAEERQARAVLFRLMNEFECIARGPGAAAELRQGLDGRQCRTPGRSKSQPFVRDRSGLFCSVGNHSGSRGLPGGAEGIRTSDIRGGGARCGGAVTSKA
jgi:hypothetical protein